MPFPLLIPAITAGIGALGGLLENKKSARTTTSTPTLAPEYKTLSDLLRGRAEDRLRSSFDTSGIEANGIQGINDSFNGVNQSIANNLTARGLANSPVAAAATTNAELARGGQISQFLNTLPQIRRQYENEDFGNALNVLNSARGQTTVGPGSMGAGAFGSAAELLAYLSGRGLLGGGNKSGGWLSN